MIKTKTQTNQRVRFEEVAPTNMIVAFLNTRLNLLSDRLQLPVYAGYDDLDDIAFSFLTLPSGKTVTLGEYAHSPEIGVDLYIDPKDSNIPETVYQSCRYLSIPHEAVQWIHPDFQEKIDLLYENAREIVDPIRPIDTTKQILATAYEPIDCFHHALKIYTRENFPEYWAMLQHNLGMAYRNRSQGDYQQNLEKSIECFHRSLEIYTHDNFPEQWEMNQHDLRQSQQLLSCLLPEDILANQPLPLPSPQ